MQVFTKNEILWIATEIGRKAVELKEQSEKTRDKTIAKMQLLRSEQYSDISQRLHTVLEKGSKRIGIK